MGKNRHSKDRLFITANEHKHEWGGKKDEIKVPIARLPFFCCSLSLLPFENPVCSPDGIIFDIVNVVPFIKKYKRNPVTGDPLKITQLIKLNFHKNNKGEYHDPVSFKIFTDFTVIVAIKTSGNVFAMDTVEELNKKPKFWKDLLTDETFSVKDIILLQDPLNLEKRTVSNFDYIKKKVNIVFEPNTVPSITQNNTGKRILSELDKKKDEEGVEDNIIKKLKLDKIDKKDYSITETDINSTNYFVQEAQKNKEFRHQLFTSLDGASSFTSTNFIPSNETEYRVLNDAEIRGLYYSKIKEKHTKGFVQIVTNFGALNIELHCDQVPKTCENFLELCEKKYYNGTKFHRLIPYFCIQGGDPEGKGSGGQSIFGAKFEDEFHPKLKHTKAGIISMANSGKNSNGSQFFITLGECPHLDNKHTVFGEIVGGIPVLDIFNKIDKDEKERPMLDIIIKEVTVFMNPFRETIKSLRESKEKKNQPIPEEQEKEYYIDKKETKSFSLKNKANSDNTTNSGTGLTSLLFDSFVLKEKSLAKQKEKK